MKLRALIIEDEKLVAWSLKEHLTKLNFETSTVEFAEQGIDIIKDQAPDLLFLDYRLPDLTGLEILRLVQEQVPSMVIFFMSAYGTEEVSVNALKLGAFEYINKPVNLEEVTVMVNRAFEQREKLHKMTLMEKEEKKLYQLGNYISQSKTMSEVMSTIKKIVRAETGTILLLGETGTGKDTLARIIHEHGTRKEKPFIVVNCASLSEHLLESELFGHEKGAFTDAKNKKLGQVELANNGTIYLDEIGEIPIAFQAKLLRFLETKSFYRVGGMKELKVNVRIIASTNRDLRKEMEAGLFREDLFYRLNVISLTIPPLRERKGDIPLLVNRLIEQFNFDLNMHTKGLADGTLEALTQYDWPGNVRELKNMLERIFLLERPEYITPDHIPGNIRKKVFGNARRTKDVVLMNDTFLEGKTWGEVENTVVKWALEKERGNQSNAAKRLKITRDQIRYKMKKHGLL